MAGAGRPAVWPLSSPVLADLAEGGSVEAGPVVFDLVDRLAQIDDPRQVSWVEHPLPVVLALCAGAVVPEQVQTPRLFQDRLLSVT